MTRAEERRQRERVICAMGWIQRKIGSAFHFEFTSTRETERLAIDQTFRGREDPDSFLVSFNPDLTAKVPFRVLRADALHEWLHAVDWPCYSRVFDRLPERERARFKDEWHASVYRKERAFAPLVLGTPRAHLRELES